MKKFSFFGFLLLFFNTFLSAESSPFHHRIFLDGLPLYYWSPEKGENFGDYLSLKIVERMTQGQASSYGKRPLLGYRKKLLALGSILHFACDDDVVWGSGINGKHLDLKNYQFTTLDVRAVRGPLTRQFLSENFSIECSEIYGDPALLLPFLFPEWTKKENPSLKYIVIPHISECALMKNSKNVVLPTEKWDVVIQKILDSHFVISSSLHGIIVAEAWGIPARLLRISENEPLFKYSDYYLGTGRTDFQFATSIEEALKMGGEPIPIFNLKALYDAFPFEYWENRIQKNKLD